MAASRSSSARGPLSSKPREPSRNCDGAAEAPEISERALSSCEARARQVCHPEADIQSQSEQRTHHKPAEHSTTTISLSGWPRVLLIIVGILRLLPARKEATCLGDMDR